MKYWAIRELVKDLLQLVIMNMPGTTGQKARYNYYKKRLKILGQNVVFGQRTYISNPEYVSIGDNTIIDDDATILAGPYNHGKREVFRRANKNYLHDVGEVYIGNCCHISQGTLLSGLCGLYIGDNCGVASGTKIYSFTNHYKSFKNPDKVVSFSNMAPKEMQSMIAGPIVIDKNVGIGVNCFIGPGITIGEDSFIGVGSVVLINIGKNKIATGNPARAVSNRFFLPKSETKTND